MTLEKNLSGHGSPSHLPLEMGVGGEPPPCPAPLCVHPQSPLLPTPSLLSSWPPSLSPHAVGHPLGPLRASPALQTPHHHPGLNSGWGQDSTAWHRDPPRAPLCPAHPGGLPERATHFPKGGAPVQLAFPSSSPEWPGPGSGRGPSCPADVPPPPLMGGSQDQGPGRQLCPRNPRKYPQAIGALGWAMRPVMAPPPSS